MDTDKLKYVRVQLSRLFIDDDQGKPTGHQNSSLPSIDAEHNTLSK
jgi:hypothetical protein